MTEYSANEILKSAILLEKRGRSLYKTVADQAQHAAVKDFFEMMAKEEDKHIQILAEQFKSYQKNKTFAPIDQDQNDFEQVASEVLSEALKDQIAAAGFEAAAISAAMSMEKRAIELYSQRAAATQDGQEKALYQWLADWESSHLDFLAKIDRELTEKIWHDNNFWPF